MAKYDTFSITVIEARNVAAMDRSGTSDPYCVLKSNFNSQKFKTKFVSKTLTPQWNSEFKFFVSKADGMIHIKLWDHDYLSADDFMGEVYVNLANYGDFAVHDEWVTLNNEPMKQKVTTKPGELHLRMQFFGTPKKEKSAAAPAAGGDAAAATAATASPAAAPAEEKKKEKPTGPPKIEDKYTLGKVLGRGAFSEVKVGIRKANGKKYAVKCINKKTIDKTELALLEREIDIMKKLQHPNIIQLMEVVDTVDTLYLVLEFAGGGELFDAIVDRGQYSEEDAVSLVKQILEAIRYVHDHGIAHRDLKPENLLLAENDNNFVKIADFGLSKDFGEEALQTSCGTPDYVAPEVLLGEPYDKEVDIWSIGVITYVLLCGFPPFYGETQKELFEHIMKGAYDFPEPEWNEVSAEAKDFISKLLVVDPRKRFTAEQCLEHAWIAGADAKKDHGKMKRLATTKFKQYNQQYKAAAGATGQEQ